jgi:hypothetical protein
MLRFTSIQEIILFDSGFIFVVGKQVHTYVSGLHRLICSCGIDAVYEEADTCSVCLIADFAGY